MKKISWPDFLVTAFLLLILGFLLAEKIDLVTLDLGRYLKNGELFWAKGLIPQTNLYSFTWPDFPFLNHHWLTGPVFFLVKAVTGFEGLSILYIGLSFLTFLLFFSLAKQESDLTVALASSLLTLPLLVSRREIRPEIFSYFFTGLIFWLLWQHRQKKIPSRMLFLIPVIELAWVNLHLYFFLGLILVTIFLIDSWIRPGAGRVAGIFRQPLCLILILSFLAVLVNPAGLEGALYPLRVYENYGYRVFEEQPLWFIEKIITWPPALYFKIIFVVLLLSFLSFWRKNRFPDFVPLALGAIFSLAGWLMIRNFSFFGYFGLFLISLNLGRVFPKEPKEIEEKFLKPGLVALSLLIFLLFLPYFRPEADSLGIGLKEANSRAADFFQKENLRGPIFNNYDIGGYLIYHLYPAERVFVDNRPAAYPSSFFDNFYIRLQEEDDFWQKASQLFSFNAIFFYWRDITPWAQKFLIARIKDSQWAPVFVDQSALIFLKRNEVNQDIIAKYEIPKSYFNVIK